MKEIYSLSEVEGLPKLIVVVLRQAQELVFKYFL